MFWKKQGPVRVEFLNPPVVVTSALVPEQPHTDQEAKSTGFPLSLDQLLKLSAIVVAVVNTILIVTGYMRYVGITQQFGISRTEVAFSLSDLLSFGYISFLNMTFSGQATLVILSSLTTVPAFAIVVSLKSKMHPVKQYLLVWTIAILLFVPVVGPYWFAFNPGKEDALKRAAKSLGLDKKLQGLDTVQEVMTENGSLTGEIILGMPSVTYLLKDGVIYKIRESDGRILRKTHLKAKLPSDPSPEPAHDNSTGQ
jgi:hypothetical protein